MTKVKSLYRVLGPFLILVSYCVFILFVVVKTISTWKPCPIENLDCHAGQIRLLFLLATLELLCLFFFVKNCKRYVLSDSNLLIINPVLPFLRKRIEWSELDYYIIVNEKSKYRSRDAIWMVHNRKLAVRISSAYYSNFDEMLDNLHLLNRGRKEFSEWDQLLMLLRAKTVG